jgi:hypothetical protein
MPPLCGLSAGSVSHPQQLIHAGLTEPSYSSARLGPIVVGLGEADSSAGLRAGAVSPLQQLIHAGLTEPSYSAAHFDAIGY